ncbi:MAG TPA: di-heme oxidoredictase family protein, partial [Longimicrobiales bacterium]
PAEFRTGILMGLIYRDAYLHDGRTRNLTEAILLHGGEATAAREAFRALGLAERQALLQFLGTL